ncbi:MAG: cytochrome C [Myxococcaceae bacterium]|nr:cytochrome C [Myxococcaceae bacterium]
MRAPAERSAVVLLVMALAVTGCPSARPRSPARSSHAVVFVSAALRGAIAPCGCSEAMRGGLARTAGALDSARAAGDDVFYFDAGDTLFGARELTEDAVPQQERKARALAEGLRAMGLVARAPGELDDVRGAGFRQSLGLPELAPGRERLLTVAAQRFAVVSCATLPVCEAAAQRARAAGSVFVLAFAATSIDVALRELPASSAIDLVVAASPKEGPSSDTNRLAGGATKVAQVQDRGRSLLRVDLWFPASGDTAWLDGDDERDRLLAGLDARIELLRAEVNAPWLAAELKALKKAKLEEVAARREAAASTRTVIPEGRNVAIARFVPLEPRLPEAPAVRAIEAAYDRDVGLINLAWAEAHGETCEPADLARAGFVGSEACVGCHPDAATVWKASKHVRSYERLVAKGKQYHLDCITCHVTGWRQPGGVCRLDDVEGRAEVGCESCHGPGWRHTQLPGRETISLGREAKTCTTCHDPENSPHFDYEPWLRAVLGPGHGRPLPDGGSAIAGRPSTRDGG